MPKKVSFSNLKIIKIRELKSSFMVYASFLLPAEKKRERVLHKKIPKTYRS